jgi:hypothetical protein
MHFAESRKEGAMLQDWAFAQQGQGITVYSVRGDVTVLEFNEFLGRIASGQIGPDDVAVSQVMTDGVQRRVGDLKLYAQVVSGQVPTETLPRRVPGGVLAASPNSHTPLQATNENYPTYVQTATHSTLFSLTAGQIVVWTLALLGFSLLCSLRPGTRGVHPLAPIHFRPVTHPEHPKWLLR